MYKIDRRGGGGWGVQKSFARKDPNRNKFAFAGNEKKIRKKSGSILYSRI